MTMSIFLCFHDFIIDWIPTLYRLFMENFEVIFSWSYMHNDVSVYCIGFSVALTLQMENVSPSGRVVVVTDTLTTSNKEACHQDFLELPEQLLPRYSMLNDVCLWGSKFWKDEHIINNTQFILIPIHFLVVWYINIKWIHWFFNKSRCHIYLVKSIIHTLWNIIFIFGSFLSLFLLF